MQPPRHAPRGGRQACPLPPIPRRRNALGPTPVAGAAILLRLLVRGAARARAPRLLLPPRLYASPRRHCAAPVSAQAAATLTPQRASAQLPGVPRLNASRVPEAEAARARAH